MRAAVWPSDSRLARLEQAIACFTAASARADAPRLVTCALPDVPARLDALPREPLILCMQTIVRDYLSAADRDRYEAGMRDFPLRRPPLGALWVELEMDTEFATSQADSAALRVRFGVG